MLCTKIVIFAAVLTSTTSPIEGVDTEFVCRQLEPLTNLCGGTALHPTVTQVAQGPPGKRGIPGARGEIGAPGATGPPGTVDYVQIDAIIEEKVSAGLEKLSFTVSNMDEKMNELIERLERTDSVVGKLCHVSVHGVCYRFVLNSEDSQNPQFEAGQKLCQNIGAKLANIYDIDGYNAIAEYMSSTIPDSRNYVAAWTGMTYNPSSGIMFLSNGTRGPTLPWYTSYPRSTSSHTKMNFDFKKDLSTVYNGMANGPPTWTRHGSLCEI